MAEADLAPVPLQSVQDSQRGILSLASFPYTASSNVISRLYWRSLPRSARVPPRWPAEKIFEDIVKDIAESAASEVEPFKPCPALRSGMAEHVVAFPFFLIAEMLIGFVDFFELFFGLLLLLFAGVEIGMMLAGKLAVGFLQIVVGRLPIDAESFVIVAFRHGSHCPLR